MTTATLATFATVPVPTAITAACGKKGERRFSFEHPALAVPPFGTSAAWLATDARVAAIVPVDQSILENTEPGAAGIRIVSVDAVKACKRTKKGPVPVIQVAPDGAAGRPGAAVHPAPLDASHCYPPIGAVLPASGSMAGRTVIHLSAAYLAKLAEALGASENGAVTLLVDPEGKKPMVVLPFGSEAADAVGLLMPRSGSDDAACRKEAARRLTLAYAILDSAERAQENRRKAAN